MSHDKNEANTQATTPRKTTPTTTGRFSVNNFFKFEQKKATWKKELLGGFTSFLALIYMVSVESNFLSKATSALDSNAGMQGTFLLVCLTIGIGTIVMGFSTNTPTIATSAMGLNAMFQFNVAGAAKVPGIGFEAAMIATIISSILIVIVSYTKLLTYIMQAIPQSLNTGIVVAFGFFIGYVGIDNMGWVNMVDGGLPEASLSHLKIFYPNILIGSAGIILILLFHFKKVPGGVGIVMIGGLIITAILANTINNDVTAQNFSTSKWNGWKYDDMNFWDNISGTFTYAFTDSAMWKEPILYIASFLFGLIALFNISSTAHVIITDVETAEDQYERSMKVMMRAVSATSVGTAIVGLSPTVLALESIVGIGQGARTGIAAITSGVCFLLTIALYPIFRLMPNCMIGAASLYIGILMATSITRIEWAKPEICISVFLMIIFTVITYSLVNGIAVGFIMYSLLSLFTKKAKQVSITMWILSGIFVIYFIAFAFVQ